MFKAMKWFLVCGLVGALVGCSSTGSPPPPAPAPPSGGGLEPPPDLTGCYALPSSEVIPCIKAQPSATPHLVNLGPVLPVSRYIVKHLASFDGASNDAVIDALGSSTDAQLADLLASNTYTTDDVEDFLRTLTPDQKTAFASALPESRFVSVMSLTSGNATTYYWAVFTQVYYDGLLPIGW